MSGEFVSELPPNGRLTTGHDWDALVIKAQSNPGGLLLAATQVPETTIKSLRQRNRAPFVTNGGTLVINQRNLSVDDATGKPCADVYFTWVLDEPATKEEEN